MRLTKQGIPDLNHYGPRPKPAAPAAEAIKTEETALAPAAETPDAAVVPAPATA